MTVHARSGTWLCQSGRDVARVPAQEPCNNPGRKYNEILRGHKRWSRPRLHPERLPEERALHLLPLDAQRWEARKRLVLLVVVDEVLQRNAAHSAAAATRCQPWLSGRGHQTSAVQQHLAAECLRDAAAAVHATGKLTRTGCASCHELTRQPGCAALTLNRAMQCMRNLLNNTML